MLGIDHALLIRKYRFVCCACFLIEVFFCGLFQKKIDVIIFDCRSLTVFHMLWFPHVLNPWDLDKVGTTPLCLYLQNYVLVIWPSNHFNR